MNIADRMRYILSIERRFVTAFYVGAKERNELYAVGWDNTFYDVPVLQVVGKAEHFGYGVDYANHN